MKERIFVLFALFMFVAAICACCPEVFSCDFLWHLRSGEWILAHHLVLDHDVFSWTVPEKPWINHFWMWQVLLAEVTDSLYDFQYARQIIWLVFCVIPVFVSACCFFAIAKRRLSDMQAFLLAVLVIAVLGLTPIMAVRPALAGFTLFTFNTYLLISGRIWLLPLTQAIWTNIHGSFPVGIVLFWLVFYREKMVFFSLLGVVILASLMNPWGLELVRHVFIASTNPEITVNVASEWLSPNFHSPQGFALLAFIILYIVAFSKSERNPSRWLSLVFFAFGLFSVRHLGFFLFFAGLVIAETLPTLKLKKIEYVLATLVALSLVTNFYVHPITHGHFPLQAVQFLKENNTKNVFHLPEWGDYLVTQDIPVCCDGRADLYMGTGIRENSNAAINLAQGADVALGFLEQLNAKTLLIPANCPLDNYIYLQKGGEVKWKEAYRDREAVIYVGKN